jgi:Chaperone of endosialidase
MNPLIQCKTTILPLFIAGVLACFGLLPKALAVVPPPDGGYPNFTTAEGTKALQSLTTGSANTAVGWYSLFSNTEGSFNTAVGVGTLLFNVGDTTFYGMENTAMGAAALLFNTTGSFNTATGGAALLSNTEGSGNTANGFYALYSNTIGSSNTANGVFALSSNTTGFQNTAIGDGALASNTTGDGNTANGFVALQVNTTGGGNTAIGLGALFSNTEGVGNTAVGAPTDLPQTTAALGSNIDGAYNTAVGQGALNNNTTGDSNTTLGNSAGGAVITASNVICVGADVAGADVSNTTWMGNVYGVTTQSGTTAPVVVSDTGQLGTIASSERFKKDIAGMENASDAILSLRPVTFHYKTDSKGTPQFGLIAEEVAKVNPALVLPDKEGKPYTVRYDQVNAMLLNEFLKEHRAFVQEQHKVEKLEATVASLVITVKEQAAQIQRVSAHLEASKPAPQVVNNP